MRHTKLQATKRTIFGKKVKGLRREGIIPGNVYGKDMASLALQIPLSEFIPVYNEVHETGIVDLELEGKTYPVLIHNIAKDYLRDQILHADFFKVNLKEKIKTSVPLVVIGEAQAVTDKVGLVMQTLQEIEVEALPEALPENIEVDVTSLAEVDQSLTVADLRAPDGVIILTDANQTVVKVTELVSKEAQEDAEAEAQEAEAAKESTEGEASDTETPEAPGENKEETPEEKSDN